jgi:hypothetical protein
MRKLVYIPIVHTPEDMGSVREGLERVSAAKLGRQRWIENVRRLERFWSEVERELDSLGLDYSRVRIYQDGLPCSGELGMKVVNSVADAGSKNFQLIRKLTGRGATLEATEDPDLLKREREHIKAIVEAGSGEERAEAEHKYNRVKGELLEARDAFIAGRIGDTLKDGEIGLLFIGAEHDLGSKLPSGILVESLP